MSEPRDLHPFNTPWSLDPQAALDAASMGDFVPPPPPAPEPKKRKPKAPPPDPGFVATPQGIVGGIDPGKAGFSALMHPDGRVETFETPLIEDVGYDMKAILDMLIRWRERGVRLVILEQQNPRAPEAMKNAAAVHTFVRAAFEIGRGFGMWETALVFTGLPHELVAASTWKARMGITVPKGAASNSDERRKIGKRLAVQQAQRLCPTVDLRRNTRCRTPDDNKAEAILMAIYGARRMQGVY